MIVNNSQQINYSKIIAQSYGFIVYLKILLKIISEKITCYFYVLFHKELETSSSKLHLKPHYNLHINNLDILEFIYLKNHGITI